MDRTLIKWYLNESVQQLTDTTRQAVSFPQLKMDTTSTLSVLWSGWENHRKTSQSALICKLLQKWDDDDGDDKNMPH